ncbi:MAG: hypothetical protein ACREAC_05045 [Blastocatellia bacterium]
MISDKGISQRNYFLHSPFRSMTFSVATLLLIGYIYWGALRMRSMQSTQPCVGNAILALALFPVSAWFYALLLHREIRNLVQAGESIPPQSKLHILVRNLVGYTLLVTFLVAEALTAYCPKR